MIAFHIRPARIPRGQVMQCGGFSCRRSIRMDTPYPKPQKSKRHQCDIVFVPAARARSSGQASASTGRGRLVARRVAPPGRPRDCRPPREPATRGPPKSASLRSSAVPRPPAELAVGQASLVAKPKSLAVIDQYLHCRGRSVAEHEHPATLNGSCRSTSLQTRARPSMPRRKSVGSTATRIRI